MADTPETPEPNISARLEALTAAVLRIEAQSRSNGEQVSKAHALLAEIRDAVRLTTEVEPVPGSAAGMLAEILTTVREASPLLHSRAAKALRAGGSVLDYLKAGRPA